MHKLKGLCLAMGCALTSAAFALTPNNLSVSPSGNFSGLSLSQRVTRLENQIQYLNTVSSQLTSLQQQLTLLRGQIEQLNHQLGQVGSQTQTVAELQNRVIQLEAEHRLANTGSHLQVKPVSLKSASNKRDRDAFNKAYTLLTERRYDKAIAEYNKFVGAYPKSPLLGNAYYWLGELYLVQGQPDKATQQFRNVLAQKDNVKIPDALVKLGMIFLANGDMAHAKQTFEKVVKNYKGTTAAKVAQQQLNSMH